MKKFSLLMLMLLFTAVVAIAQPPLQVLQTGANPTFMILQGAGESFSNVPIEQGDYICSYFVKDGLNYIVGAKPIEEGKSTNLVAYLHQKEDELMPDSLLAGAPAGDQLYLCLFRNGIYYDVKAFNIQMFGETNKTVPEIKAYPLTIFIVGRVVINLNNPIALNEVGYVTWERQQCPLLPVAIGEVLVRRQQVNWYSKGTLTHKDGRVWETTKLGTISEFKLMVPFSKYSSDLVVTVDQADGVVEKSTYSVDYKLKSTDLERGYVSFKVEAVKYPGCGLKSSQYYYLKYEFDTLPEPENPKVLIKEADPLPPPGFVDVSFIYDRVITSSAYWKLVAKGTDVYLVNHLNYTLSIEIREVGATRIAVGSGVQKASAKLLTMKLTDKRLLNKSMQVKATSWQIGLDEVVEFVFK